MRFPWEKDEEDRGSGQDELGTESQLSRLLVDRVTDLPMVPLLLGKMKRLLTTSGHLGLITVNIVQERPLERGDSESAWSRNRRAEFRLKSGGDGKVEDTLSGSGGSSSGRSRSR